jgi:hypothetical protein
VVALLCRGRKSSAATRGRGTNNRRWGTRGNYARSFREAGASAFADAGYRQSAAVFVALPRLSFAIRRDRVTIASRIAASRRKEIHSI